MRALISLRTRRAGRLFSLYFKETGAGNGPRFSNYGFLKDAHDDPLSWHQDASGVVLLKGTSFTPPCPRPRAGPPDGAWPRAEERAREIIARFDDKDWSLCDAICFEVMVVRSVRTTFSFDHHSRQFGRFELLGGQREFARP